MQDNYPIFQQMVIKSKQQKRKNKNPKKTYAFEELTDESMTMEHIVQVVARGNPESVQYLYHHCTLSRIYDLYAQQSALEFNTL